MSGLDLRHRESMLAGGKQGPALVPGKAQESLLFLAASHTGELKMLPEKPPLPSEDLKVLREWIDAGAPWGLLAASHGDPEPTWWSLDGWFRNPIDAFILAKLEEKGLGHAPETDKRSLIRRASFDLTGLPPTPEQIDSFLGDSSPDALTQVRPGACWQPLTATPSRPGGRCAALDGLPFPRQKTTAGSETP